MWVVLVLLVVGLLVWSEHEDNPAELSPEPPADLRSREPSSGLTGRAPPARPAPVDPLQDPVPLPAPAPAATEPDESVILYGVVETAAGHPVARAKIDANGRGWSWTEDDGTFSTTVSGPGTYKVRAHFHGLFDADVSKEVVVQAGRDPPFVRLRLSPESGVHGRAVLPDGKPAAGVLLKVTTVNNDMGIGRFAEGIWSSFSARSWLSVRTDEHGGFSFGGLDPRSTYAIWWMGGNGQYVRHPDDVNAGQSNLRLEIERRRIELVFHDPQTKDWVEEVEWKIIDLDGEIEPNVDLDPQLNHGSDWDEPDYITRAGRRLRILAFCWGHTYADLVYETKQSWGTQEVIVPLKRLPGDGARLEVEARDPQGRVIEDMTFRQTFVDDEGRELMDVGLHLIGASGHFETRVPPCRLRIRTARRKPLRGGWQDPTLLLVPAMKTVDVPAEGVLRVQLDMQQGGAARLVFTRPKDPGHYRSGYLLYVNTVDDKGQPVPALWAGSGGAPTPPERVIDTDDPPRSTPLAPGRYEVTVYEDFSSIDLVPVKASFWIRAGKVTDVPIQLVREGER